MSSKKQFKKYELGNICSIIKGKYPISKTKSGKYALVVTAKERKTANSFQIDSKAVCIPLVSSTGHGHASMNRIHYEDGKFALANIMVALIPDLKICDAKYLYYYLNAKKEEYFIPLMRGSANVTLAMRDIGKIELDLPSLDQQTKILTIFEKLNETKRKSENISEILSKVLPATFFKIFGDVFKQNLYKTKILSELTENLDTTRIPLNKDKRKQIQGDIPYYGASGVVDYLNDFIFDEQLLLISEDGENLHSRKKPIAYTISGKSWVNNHAHVLRIKNNVTIEYLQSYFNQKDLQSFFTGATRPKLNKTILMDFDIPIPPMNLQEKFSKLKNNLTQILINAEKSQELVKSLDDTLALKVFHN
jgi:type I restriction enzyme, S subunit